MRHHTHTFMSNAFTVLCSRYYCCMCLFYYKNRSNFDKFYFSFSSLANSSLTESIHYLTSPFLVSPMPVTQSKGIISFNLCM